MRKERKQLRLHDIYRCAVTGLVSNIRGILHYDVSRDATELRICVGDDNNLPLEFTFLANDEAELRDTIYRINKMLNGSNPPRHKVNHARGEKHVAE
jgi:hypothetical protein